MRRERVAAVALGVAILTGLAAATTVNRALVEGGFAVVYLP